MSKVRRTCLALALAACRPAPPDLPPSPPRSAVDRLIDRCDRGDGPACLEVAYSLRDVGDRRRALAYVTRACELANPHACADLADVLTRGDELPRNDARALDLRVQACLGGLAPACRAAADALPTDQAAPFRQRACDAGDRTQCPSPPPPPPPPLDPRDEAAVVLALAGRRGAMRACYEASLAEHPRLRGSVTLQVAVDPAGRPRAVAVVDGIDEHVDACVATVAASTVFAPTHSGEIVVVRWRAVFEPRE